jgi:hypothetical protein
MPKIVDLSNRKFGELLVLEKVKSIDRNSRWLCKCECGNTKEVRASHLISEHIDNCGCQTRQKCISTYKHDGPHHPSNKTIEDVVKYNLGFN